MSTFAQEARSFIKKSWAWSVLKYLQPKYRPPLIRLGQARAGALLGPTIAKGRLVAKAYADLGQVHLASDYLPEAVASCEAAILRDPCCIDAYLCRDEALQRQGRREQAFQSLDGIRDVHCDEARHHIALADAFLRLGDALEALRQFERARARQPDIAWPRGGALASQDRLTVAQNLLAYLGDQPTPAKRSALVRAATEKAEAASREKQTPEAWLTLQSCYGLEGRHADQLAALRRYGELRESQPAYIPGFDGPPRLGEVPEVWAGLVSTHLTAGEYAAAERALSRYFTLLEQRPSRAQLRGEQRTEFLPDVCARGIGCMGHLTAYVKSKLLLGTNERLVLCAPPPDVVNPALLSYFRPFVDILETPEAIAAARASKAATELPLELGMRFGGPARYLNTVMGEINRRWAQEGRPPLLRLSDHDKARGREALRSLGLGPDDWWTCLHVRASSYRNDAATEAFRDADIATYQKAVDLVIARGGHVFRMGDPSMPRLPEMDRVIDYAHSALRNDWMDVFLCAESRFYLGTNSGLQLVPGMFGVPSIHSNHLPIRPSPYQPDDVFVPKLLRTPGGNLMHFREMMREPYACAISEVVYRGTGVAVVNNSEDELAGAVAEMLESFDASGRRSPPQPTGLQRRFDELVAEAGISISGRPSADFLSRHPELLA